MSRAEVNRQLKTPPLVITPSWVASIRKAVHQEKDGDIADYAEWRLFRVVLQRIAEGAAEPPQHCAREALQ